MNAKDFADKLSRAATVLGELADTIHTLQGGGAEQGFDQAPSPSSGRASVNAQTEIDEPEIGWRMGFIRLCDGRCPWCGERIELVTCDSHGAGLTWKCPEACNP